eukprot:scaffold27412_cov94-Skeletonema_dohrnii-CCMP3373.AAC.2
MESLSVTRPLSSNNGAKQYTWITNETEVHEPVNHNLTHRHEIIETVPVTIVCQLSGEMGNNLGMLGRCLSLKLWLESGAFYNSTNQTGAVQPGCVA